MIVKNKYHKEEKFVVAMAIYNSEEFIFKDRVIFYCIEDGMIGVGIEVLDEVEIIDANFGTDFIFQRHERGHGAEGFAILWNHFKNIDHLAGLIDLEDEILEKFELARLKLKQH